MARGHHRARIGVKSSDVCESTETTRVKEEVMKKHAPRVRELTVKILESLKELADLEAEMKTESPVAKFTHGMIPHHVAAFKDLKEKAEKLMG